ncbi:MAG: DUF1566 domain-containing protein [Nitrospirae bacterium]|nr:MAG: DUF1566 domain-containing protein [Nitrospirota bacterium]
MNIRIGFVVRLIMAILLTLSVAAFTYAAEKPKPKQKLMDNYIAVFDVETTGKIDSDIARPLTESIRRELVMSKKYEVIDRGNMNKILGEQKFQMSGCVSGQCIVEAGQLLGAGKIIAGSVSLVGKTYYLTLSLINVETGKIENVSEDECECRVDDLIKSSKRLVKKLLGESVPEAPTITASGKREEQEKIATERFTFKNGIIEDSKLALQWVPAPSWDMNHYEAGEYVQKLSLNGGGWRLPTRAELKSLYDKSKPGNADTVFGVGDKWVWTSELDGSSNAWYFYFAGGSERMNARAPSYYYGYRVLPVRSRR